MNAFTERIQCSKFQIVCQLKNFDFRNFMHFLQEKIMNPCATPTIGLWITPGVYGFPAKITTCLNQKGKKSSASCLFGVAYEWHVYVRVANCVWGYWLASVSIGSAVGDILMIFFICYTTACRNNGYTARMNFPNSRSRRKNGSFPLTGSKWENCISV